MRTMKYATQVITGMTIIALAACNHANADYALDFDPGAYSAELAIVERAVNLATVSPYNTVQMHVRTELGNGSPVPAVIQFSASDSTIMVDSAGHVTAMYPTTNPSYVRVMLTYNGVTRRDSVPCQVTEGVPQTVVSGLSIETAPDAPPSVPLILRNADGFDATGTAQLAISAFDTRQQPVPGVLLSITSSDTAVATIDPSGYVTAVRLGHVTFRVMTSAYGKTFEDSLAFVVGLPLRYTFTAVATTDPRTKVTSLRWDGDTIHVGQGAIVDWINLTSIPVDVKFDDPSSIQPASANPLFGAPDTGGGDIGQFFHDPTIPVSGDFITNYMRELTESHRARAFSQIGVFPYHSTTTAARGVVIVCADTQPCSR